MIDYSNPTTSVPSLPSPRKGKFILKGKFTLMDVVIALISIVLIVIIICIVGVGNVGGGWGIMGIIIGVALIDLALCWPMGFLGKEKIYIFIFRMIRFRINITKLTSEKWKIVKGSKTEIEKTPGGKYEIEDKQTKQKNKVSDLGLGDL